MFQKTILNHYKFHGRDLPWRKTTDRYHILVSEIMLQQTQVDRVIPKYVAWLKVFPTVEALAKAPLKSVLQLWSGLGYNNRAKRLHDSAKIISKEHDNVVPDTIEALTRLPGIGPYTARSILIFADNKNIATVDTNIRRILIHELNLQENISEKELFEIAQDILPKGQSRDWHNALMDFGATVLTSKKTGIKPKTTQSKFVGSRRQVRGAIIRKLTLRPHQKSELCTLTKTYNVTTILDELEAEGLIRKEKNRYDLAR